MVQEEKMLKDIADYITTVSISLDTEHLCNDHKDAKACKEAPAMRGIIEADKQELRESIRNLSECILGEQKLVLGVM